MITFWNAARKHSSRSARSAWCRVWPSRKSSRSCRSSAAPHRKRRPLRKPDARAVLPTDPYVQGDNDLLPLEQVVPRSDLLILCTTRSAYRDADLRGKPLIDKWNIIKQ